MQLNEAERKLYERILEKNIEMMKAENNTIKLELCLELVDLNYRLLELMGMERYTNFYNMGKKLLAP